MKMRYVILLVVTILLIVGTVVALPKPVSVSIDLEPTTFRSGDKVTLTITIRNDGDAGTVIVSPAPRGIQYDIPSITLDMAKGEVRTLIFQGTAQLVYADFSSQQLVYVEGGETKTSGSVSFTIKPMITTTSPPPTTAGFNTGKGICGPTFILLASLMFIWIPRLHESIPQMRGIFAPGTKT